MGPRSPRSAAAGAQPFVRGGTWGPRAPGTDRWPRAGALGSAALGRGCFGWSVWLGRRLVSPKLGRRSPGVRGGFCGCSRVPSAAGPAGTRCPPRRLAGPPDRAVPIPARPGS